jgi:hypothetical protein
MTQARELLRLAGYVVMAFGAWYHQPWLILPGFLVILLAWICGEILLIGDYYYLSHK